MQCSMWGMSHNSHTKTCIGSDFWSPVWGAHEGGLGLDGGGRESQFSLH